MIFAILGCIIIGIPVMIAIGRFFRIILAIGVPIAIGPLGLIVTGVAIVAEIIAYISKDF